MINPNICKRVIATVPSNSVVYLPYGGVEQVAFFNNKAYTVHYWDKDLHRVKKAGTRYFYLKYSIVNDGCYLDVNP